MTSVEEHGPMGTDIRRTIRCAQAQGYKVVISGDDYVLVKNGEAHLVMDQDSFSKWATKYP